MPIFTESQAAFDFLAKNPQFGPEWKPARTATLIETAMTLVALKGIGETHIVVDLEKDHGRTFELDRAIAGIKRSIRP